MALSDSMDNHVCGSQNLNKLASRRVASHSSSGRRMGKTRHLRRLESEIKIIIIIILKMNSFIGLHHICVSLPSNVSSHKIQGFDLEGKNGTIFHRITTDKKLQKSL